MSKTAVIDDWEAFKTFLSAQPLCQWSIQKQREINSGLHPDKGRSSIHTPAAPKADNAKLAEALASMA